LARGSKSAIAHENDLVTRLKFGDVVGYTLLIAAACFGVTAVAMALIPPDL
jgi:hypothetical protein